MPKFPEPPDVTTLAAISPALKLVPGGTVLWRIHKRGGSHPTKWSQFRHFGPVNSRFDHHPLPRRVHAAQGIYYAAKAGTTCIAEFFQDTRVLDRTKDAPWLVAFQLEKDVNLLDLSGAWPTKAGASMVINSGPRPRARRWSQAFYLAYPDIDGLWYCSSMNANEPAVALYERAFLALPGKPRLERALADPVLLPYLKNAAHTFGYGIV